MLINYGAEPYEENLSIGEFIMQETADISFEHPEIANVYQTAIKRLSNGQSVEPDNFISPEDPQTSQLVIGLLDMKYFVSEGWYERHRIHTSHESEDLPKATFKIVLRLKRKKLEALIAENDADLKLAEDAGNIIELENLLKMRMQLKSLYDQVTSQLGIVVSK